MIKESKTNAAWRRIFEELDVVRHLEADGMFEIDAGRIAKISHREPRLMTKFDRRNDRPKILRKHAVTILPISNGKYVLLKGDGYIDIPPPKTIVSYDSAHLREIQTIPWRDSIQSEPQAIDSLFMSSAVKSFVGDDTLLLTMRGKSRSRPFSFRFATTLGEVTLQVDGAQIEIDSGYEGKLLLLLEAKMGTIDDSIIRQVYYPLRHWQESRIAKRIITAQLVYSNKVYSLYEFSFKDSMQYQSAYISRQIHYLLEERAPVPNFADVISHKTVPDPEGVPFPQADDLSKIIDVLEILSSGPLNKFDIAEKFEVDPRQGDYYANGAAWLGFVERKGTVFRLTGRGSEFIKRNRSDRLARLEELVSQMPVFHDTASAWAKHHQLTQADITADLKRRYHLSESTANRRAITVRSWVQWLSEQLKS
jgi:hypothetical protein